jgi:proteasome lid subunit RPN8/RPN11
MLATLLLATTLIASDRAIELYGYLLAAGKFGMTENEEAAFLVQSEKGLRLWRWQSKDAFRASYSGKPPKGTVAVVHTHPYWSIEPSQHDRAEARRIGMPIIVVTRDAVIAANPDGTVVTLRQRGELKSPRLRNEP